ncbi:hypothetical protein PHLGIDRAFT_122284 [Phlebiopsis gigantea 11061_1 CR5-6]|uniref:Uncharacterized protein n=1 Tax=Phlebiopsis gigantea (strain 11061_1 CR5-6) TaxID=745531 RepID=A0A0C3RRD8_PHLG1|nr:hypothetical protein PHLGIDRAFT_122284 [Phlebiopsis gigantea 11061_1 CR5-6]
MARLETPSRVPDPRTPMPRLRSPSPGPSSSASSDQAAKENVNRKDATLANERNKTLFERLRTAREEFFQKLNAREGKNIDEDFLDDLYVLAKSWQAREDLVRPSELR